MGAPLLFFELLPSIPMRSGAASLLLALLTSVAAAQPTKHIIEFSGITYEPDTVYAAVGDTIEWQGDFTSHPLRSEPVTSQRFPADAPEIKKDDGAEYQYVIKVPGEHAYYCLYHIAQGMVGTILVPGSGVSDKAKHMGVSTSPNPASNTIELAFTLEDAADVHITVVDLQGREVLQTGGTCKTGQNRMLLNVASLPPGLYCYRLIRAEAVTIGKFTIVR